MKHKLSHRLKLKKVDHKWNRFLVMRFFVKFVLPNGCPAPNPAQQRPASALNSRASVGMISSSPRPPRSQAPGFRGGKELSDQPPFCRHVTTDGQHQNRDGPGTLYRRPSRYLRRLAPGTCAASEVETLPLRLVTTQSRKAPRLPDTVRSTAY